MSERFFEISGLRFDEKLFTEGFKDPNGPNSCTSKCCQHGVYLDPVERDRILEHAETVVKYMDGSQTNDRARWFDNNEEEDPDFPSGKCVSTEVHNDKCVFLDSKGRCSLQVAEREEGMTRFSLKPYYCILFPIVKVNGVFEYDDFCSGDAACCTSAGDCERKMVETCSIELEHAVGTSKYEELLSFYQDLIANSVKSRKDSVGTGK